MTEFLPESDKNLAFDSIIMNLLIIALDYDIAAIRQSKLKFSKQHALFMETIRNRILADHSKLKKELHKKGIKVFDRTQVNQDFVSYKYLVRGYESEFRFFIAALKGHTEKKLESYYSLITNH